jgi:hypothetical protein
MKSNPNMECALEKACKEGLITRRTENNAYLKVSYKGAGEALSEKWNVKIYTSGSVVCIDEKVLNDILAGTVGKIDKNKKVLQCDDSGWGFPLCGTMVGVTDGISVMTDIVDVSYFQTPAFEDKAYLTEYARKGWGLITKNFKATPDTHRIEICTGYINSELREILRHRGYDVTVVEIKGLLQDSLEGLFKEYVKKTLGVDLCYDPKELKTSQGRNAVSAHYYKALNWGKENAPHMLKTGWRSMK